MGLSVCFSNWRNYVLVKLRKASYLFYLFYFLAEIILGNKLNPLYANNRRSRDGTTMLLANPVMFLSYRKKLMKRSRKRNHVFPAIDFFRKHLLRNIFFPSDRRLFTPRTVCRPPLLKHSYHRPLQEFWCDFPFPSNSARTCYELFVFRAGFLHISTSFTAPNYIYF